jgi:Calx-beta domain
MQKYIFSAVEYCFLAVRWLRRYSALANWVSAGLLVVGLANVAVANGATIDVLWYTYGAPTSLYRSQVLDLANRAATMPESAKVQWRVTFFGPTDPAPTFANYNVLVIQNAEGFRTGPTPTDPNLSPDYAGILNNKLAIEAARGDRTLISGSDADFHAIRGDSGNCVPVNGCFLYDGAVGYVVNAINWAGSGQGMGVVSFYHGELAGGFWWNHPNSFLSAELTGRYSAARDNQPPVLADLPLNRSLTPTGLSNWTNAFHGRFADVPGYTGVQFAASAPTLALSIATTAFVTAPAGPAPLLQFELANYQITESGATITLRVTREENALGAVSVDYATRNGSAVSTADFTVTSGTISFADGDQTAKTISVPITNDTLAEATENLTVELTNPTGSAQIGTRSVATIEIIDDDVAVSSGGGGGGGGCAMNPTSTPEGSLAALLFIALGWRARRCFYAHLPRLHPLQSGQI